MSKVIKVNNISKAYQLGEFSTGTLSRDIERFIAKIRGKEDPFLKIGQTNDRTIKGESNVVWSLKDIDFEINQGETVGVIGKNGAGKSTPLKILSRVTSPTTGNIKIKGRIASLLEVGTGFHPELTGKENIFLNGAILGMRKGEIKRKLDEIIDFAGIQRYVDTPVKRYSSGMYVRLAFAVAAHLESEILIVDEVLAVGDAEFQKKCLGKMSDISSGEGRTILFVSHNMGSINQLCKRSILLNSGTILKDDLTNNVTRAYIDLINPKNVFGYLKEERDESKIAEFSKIQLLSKPVIDYSDPIIVHFEGFVKNFFPGLIIGVAVQDVNLVRVTTIVYEIKPNDLIGDKFSGTLTIPENTLAPNSYSLKLALWNNLTHTYDYVDKTCEFQIKDNGTELALYEELYKGFLIIKGKWEFGDEKNY